MYKFITINLKCPVCEKSLMDKENLVDNSASVHVKIKLDNKKGDLRLSSIYGSYNFSSSIDIPMDAIPEFYCPHCSSQLISEEKCKVCLAPMIPFHLIEGGKLQICSRRGCKKHYIEFEDFEFALKHFSEEFSYGHHKQIGKPGLNSTKKPSHKMKQKQIDKEIIESGSYLFSFCPYCHKSLNEHNTIKLKIKNLNGEIGYLYLSPYLNVFTHKSTIHLPERKKVKDISCPHCGKSFIEKEKKCELCGSDIARISINAVRKLIDFYICTKKGCTWHGLSDEDLNLVLLEDSEEW